MKTLISHQPRTLENLMIPLMGQEFLNTTRFTRCRAHPSTCTGLAHRLCCPVLNESMTTLVQTPGVVVVVVVVLLLSGAGSGCLKIIVVTLLAGIHPTLSTTNERCTSPPKLGLR